MLNDHLSRFLYLRWFTDIQIILASENSPPFDVEAFVYEQDTALILGQTHEIKKPVESTENLMNQALEMQPLTPGHVLVKGKFPVQLLAIIHDFDQEPSWREEWIEQAFHNIVQISEQHQLQSIGMPLLGTVHGNLSIHRSLTLLRSVIEQISPTYLKRLWLITPIPPEKDSSQTQITYH
ncbi:conserved hypothetical protein [Beggiatoa sp. PS]|nr:conserved hypothetical protein [Beggiatoa sp. PS]